MPKRSSKRKDLNELTFNLVGLTTGQIPPEPEKQLTPIQSAASAMGKIGGPKGGKARAAGLTKKQRSEVAKKAATVRWTSKRDQS
jgi:hypothetical protein